MGRNINVSAETEAALQRIGRAENRDKQIIRELEALQEQVAALTPPNDDGMKYFAYSNQDDIDTYATRKEAIAAAKEMVGNYADQSDGYWDEEVESILWGTILGGPRKIPAEGDNVDYEIYGPQGGAS